MDTQLRKDTNRRSFIFRRIVEVAEDYLARQRELAPGIFVPDIPLDDLPEQGVGALSAIEHFRREYEHLLNTSAGPRYFGFVTGGATPAAVAGDWLVSVYDQNACGSHDSVAPQLERQTIHFFRQLFRLDKDYFGTFVTGATMANFTGLAIARQWVGEQHGVDPAQEGTGSFPLRIISATPHASVIKSMAMLGIGRNKLHRINTLPGRECIDIEELESYLARHREPLIVVANAGTVNTVDFDDLAAIGSLKDRYDFWLHVDAAFGGFAACSEKFSHLTEGINRADSVTIDAHKWLNVPYDGGMQFTRRRDLQLKVFQNGAAYLGDPGKTPDFFHYTPENSRRWRALPAWFTLLAYGRAGYREIVERNCAVAKELGELVAGDPHFELLSPVRMNVVCFTVRHPMLTFEILQNFLNAIRDDGTAFFTPTVYQGKPAIRAAVSNWQTMPSDIQAAWRAVTRTWDEFQHTMNR